MACFVAPNVLFTFWLVLLSCSEFECIVFFALGIAAEIFCEATNKRLQRIARPAGERPNLIIKSGAKSILFQHF
jgi:hypothetical protein